MATQTDSNTIKTVLLPRVTVNEDVRDGLRQLSKDSGAPVSWHRRRAYELYLGAQRP